MTNYNATMHVPIWDITEFRIGMPTGDEGPDDARAIGMPTSHVRLDLWDIAGFLVDHQVVDTEDPGVSPGNVQDACEEGGGSDTQGYW